MKLFTFILLATTVFISSPLMASEGDDLCSRIVNFKDIKPYLGTNHQGQKVPALFYKNQCTTEYSDLTNDPDTYVTAESLCTNWHFQISGLRCNNSNFNFKQKLGCAFTILYACQYVAQKYFFEQALKTP